MSKTQAQFDRELAAAGSRLPAARAQLMKVPGVVDVGVGIKSTRGGATEEVALLVYVATKQPLSALPPEQRVPPVVEGLPTDVVACTGIPPTDVLHGGGEMTQNACGAGGGTLGDIGATTAAIGGLPSGSPVMLTNWHVADGIGDPVGSHGCFCDCCCCACGRVGEIVAENISADADASIASIDEGQRFTNEILAIGAVRGAGVAAPGRVVLKYGQRTGLTRGRIMSVTQPVARTDDKNFTNQIRVAPIGMPQMGNQGDSGSVFIDEETRAVVGLNHAGVGESFGNRIQPVMNLLKIGFPVMGTPGAIPLASLASEHGPTLLQSIDALRTALEQSPRGQHWLELVRRHAPEVRDLVNHDRHAMLAWQQCHGPAFVANYLKAVRDASHRVPREIGGVRAENVIVAMASVLQRTGSPDLTRAISEHYLLAMQFAADAAKPETLLRRARQLVAGGAPMAVTAGGCP